jgi:hypothetical protein
MQSTARRDGMTTYDGRDLGGLEALPLRQEKNLAVAGSQAP